MSDVLSMQFSKKMKLSNKLSKLSNYGFQLIKILVEMPIEKIQHNAAGFFFVSKLN
jgi:hypothetical protein